MSKENLFTRSGGYVGLVTNASRLRTGDTEKETVHVNDCGCLSCRVTKKADAAIDRKLNIESAPAGEPLAPTPGIFNNNSKQKRGESKRVASGPLMLPRGVLARDPS